MDDFSAIFFRAVFQENLALAYFLGMCTFLAVSREVKTTIGLGVAVIVVETISVPLNSLIYNGLLRQGALDWAGLGHLDFSYLGCPVPRARRLLAVDSGQLCHSWRLPVHGAA
jgi:Na+-transporting NADH:ubiquinone oxidoreductase subunit E